jgi:hypothetical protein
MHSPRIKIFLRKGFDGLALLVQETLKLFDRLEAPA